MKQLVTQIQSWVVTLCYLCLFKGNLRQVNVSSLPPFWATVMKIRLRNINPMPLWQSCQKQNCNLKGKIKISPPSAECNPQTRGLLACMRFIFSFSQKKCRKSKMSSVSSKTAKKWGAVVTVFLQKTHFFEEEETQAKQESADRRGGAGSGTHQSAPAALL